MRQARIAQEVRLLVFERQHVLVAILDRVGRVVAISASVHRAATRRAVALSLGALGAHTASSAADELAHRLVVHHDELEALHLADVALEGQQALAQAEVPQPDRAVVRGREEERASGARVLVLDRGGRASFAQRLAQPLLALLGSRTRPKRDGVDPITMPSQRVALARAEVPDLDVAVGTAAGERVLVKVETDDAFGVALERPHERARAPVPDLERAIHRASDQLGLVELQTPHTARVALEHTQHLARLEIPDAGGAVVAAGDDHREGGMREVLVELQTHDAVRVTGEGARSEPASTPVALDGQALAVDRLPRTRLGNCARRRARRSLAVEAAALLLERRRVAIAHLQVALARYGARVCSTGRRGRGAGCARSRLLLERSGVGGGGDGAFERARCCRRGGSGAVGAEIARLGRAELDGGARSSASTLAEERQAPAALFALAFDVLLAHVAPEQIVVGQLLPRAAHLCGAAEADGVEVTEHLERDLAREEREGVDADGQRELRGEKRELAEAAHGEDALQDESSAGVRRGREERPHRVDGGLIGQRQTLDRLRRSKMQEKT
ncbi:hypothetical protein L1887_51584 [Cichorium endivia]|nr:hypothetical protein L1887_51584 [Cichorium endivia]